MDKTELSLRSTSAVGIATAAAIPALRSAKVLHLFVLDYLL